MHLFLRKVKKLLLPVVVLSVVIGVVLILNNKSDVSAAISLDTSTVSYATSAGFQRSMFLDTVSSTYWSFYFNGTVIEYASSPDGRNWTARGTAASSDSSSADDFSLWYAVVSGTPTVYMVYPISTVIKAVKGTISTSSISWGTSNTVYNAVTGQTTPHISRDSSGTLWVSFLATNTPNPNGMYILSSVAADDTSSWSLSSTIIHPNMYNAGVVPLTTSGYMYSVYAWCDTAGTDSMKIEGMLYNGTWQGITSISTNTVAGGVCPSGNANTDLFSIVSSSSDQVHLVYMDESGSATTGAIQYRKYSSGSWGNAVALASITSGQYAAISVDPNHSNNLYAYYYDNSSGGTIKYRTGVSPYTAGDWAAATTLESPSATIAYISTMFYVNYLSSVIYTQGTGSPYTVYLSSIIVNTEPNSPIARTPSYGGKISNTKLLEFSTTDADYIEMHYGNSSAADAQAATSVWNSNYISVHHLKETGNGTSGEYIDSTTNVNHGQGGSGTSSAVPTKITTGEIGNAQSFDGSEDYIRRSVYSTALGSTLTICAWVNPVNTTGEQRIATMNRNPTNFTNEWVFQLNSGKIHFWDYGAASAGYSDLTGFSNTTLTTSAWNYVCFVKNGTSGTYYLNGSADGTKTGAADYSYGTADYILGKDYRDNNKWLNGSIDEMRVSNTNLTADWIATEFKSQSNTLTSISGEERNTTAWKYKQRISFHNSTQTSNLANFPVMVHLTSSNFNFQNARTAGQDIRFYDPDGTALSYEIEKWDYSNQDAIIWVKVPQIDAGTGSDYLKYVVYVYNTSANDGTNCTGSLLETGDQTSSQTGFSNQDTQSGAAYQSGTVAQYNIQASLSAATSYCWQVKATDPGGGNAYSGKSPAYLFTTSTAVAVPTLVSPASGATGVSRFPLFLLRTTDADSDPVEYKIVLYASDCTSAPAPYGTVQTFDQTSSQTNWLNKNELTNSAYSTGTTIGNSAMGMYQLTTTPLNANTTYCWKGAANDVGGTNTFSSYSSTQTFTTSTQEVKIKGGVSIRGGTKIQ